MKRTFTFILLTALAAIVISFNCKCQNGIVTADSECGFLTIDSEWWHFNLVTAEEAQAEYKIID